ncbi:hypothetical protein BDZ89DRAFT_1065423 [Hymenopellis radicata]|nr:hypothetical protein BDZ89DRAFT_1065423 [Hymenopellis radicata]
MKGRVPDLYASEPPAFISQCALTITWKQNCKAGPISMRLFIWPTRLERNGALGKGRVRNSSLVEWFGYDRCRERMGSM